MTALSVLMHGGGFSGPVAGASRDSGFLCVGVRVPPGPLSGEKTNPLLRALSGRSYTSSRRHSLLWFMGEKGDCRRSTGAVLRLAPGRAAKHGPIILPKAL